ncbi:MAG: hypothetical protein AAF253_09415 [Pseudomonadota bacterium]
MTTLKQAAEMLAKLARDEAVDPRTLRSVSAALSAKLASLQAPDAAIEQLVVADGDRRRAANRPKRVRIDRARAAAGPAQAGHLAALERAGTDETAFAAAMDGLLADKAVTVTVLRAIAADYTGTPITTRSTRADTERALRQAFARRQWQDEAYRRLDKLNTSP